MLTKFTPAHADSNNWRRRRGGPAWLFDVSTSEREFNETLARRIAHYWASRGAVVDVRASRVEGRVSYGRFGWKALWGVRSDLVGGLPTGAQLAAEEEKRPSAADRMLVALGDGFEPTAAVMARAGKERRHARKLLRSLVARGAAQREVRDGAAFWRRAPEQGATP